MNKKRCVLSGVALLALALIGGEVRAATFEAAQNAFGGLSQKDRVLVPLMLIAIGDYNGMADGNFNHRIFRGITAFQSSVGDQQTGVLTGPEKDRLLSGGYAFMGSIGLKEVKFPDEAFSLFVPLALVGEPTRTDQGFSFEAGDKSAAVDFSRSTSTLPALFKKFAAERADRSVTYKVLVRDFFVVSGAFRGRKFYTRYRDGGNAAIGFTFTWDETQVPSGDKIAVLMSNLFLPAANSGEVAPPTESSETSPPGAVTEPTVFTGTGFFVSSDGLVLTNRHVVESCHSISVIGRGSGALKAADAQNDLALLQVVGASIPARFRQTQIKLGEAIYVLGFPYAGTLDNGLNITNGLVSSLSGVQNDSRYVQITAPVQPGNSGGPVVDAQGLVTGIATARLNDMEVLKRSGSLPQNVNFAIRADMLVSFLRANGFEPKTESDDAPLTAAAIAAQGRDYTVQIICTN